MLKIEDPDIIYAWGIKELWNALNLIEDTKQYQEKIVKIKYGIDIQVPIIYIIKGWITEYPENKKVSIKGHGKEDIVKYYDEIDEREKLMREIILEEIEEEDPTSPRMMR